MTCSKLAVSSRASAPVSTPELTREVISSRVKQLASGNTKPAVIFLGDSNCAALVTGLHGRPRGERCAEWAALCERFDCDNRGTNQLTLEGLTTQLRSRATCDALGRAAAAVVYIGKNDVASNGCEFIENKVAEIVADVRERMPPAHRRNILVLGLNAPDAPPPAAPDAPPTASSSAPSPGGASSPTERFMSVAALNSRLAELLPPLGAAFLDVRAHVAAAGAGSGGGVAGEGGGRPVIVVERRVLARVDQPLEEGDELRQEVRVAQDRVEHALGEAVA